VVQETARFKNTSGNDLTLLGSGTILTLFADHGLIDEYQIMIDPLAIGSGAPIFRNIKHSLKLKLLNTRTFKSGVVLLSYRPDTLNS
jgi:dihydrofolate reductase